MVIKISPATNEVIVVPPVAIVMASNRADRVARLLNEDCLTDLLDGADAQATQSFFEDYLCNDFDTGSSFATLYSILYNSQ